MDNSSTMTSGAVEVTCADARVWRDRLQPGARLLADLVITVPGTTLPTSGKSGVVGQVAVQWIGAVPAFATTNYMDVPLFRKGRPPV